MKILSLSRLIGNKSALKESTECNYVQVRSISNAHNLTDASSINSFSNSVAREISRTSWQGFAIDTPPGGSNEDDGFDVTLTHDRVFEKNIPIDRQKSK
ncbi:hypothetical protein A0O28_0006990 [Trichoderma guizhouense]|uniref:Uncharacterized protein n=1 Tax=Trichoderma guizhouense TaxID=1491466 RepID=A0A1T3CHN6_9HYPO|nr:hypothetical protein A0O28_0006990 [Trichoderma guizhouense]